MPLYTYVCPKCGQFEKYLSFANYTEKVKCECGKLSHRDVLSDADSVFAIGDGAPRTLGALADKNRDKMSNDEIIALRKKHNPHIYGPKKELPKEGMRRLKPNDNGGYDW